LIIKPANYRQVTKVKVQKKLNTELKAHGRITVSEDIGLGSK